MRQDYVNKMNMLEIERVSIQKQCDTLNKIKLLEAKQEMGETIRGFVQRLCRLAFNLTAKCMSKSCTEANTEMIILPELVKGVWTTCTHRQNSSQK
jgi:hypothetical protein